MDEKSGLCITRKKFETMSNLSTTYFIIISMKSMSDFKHLESLFLLPGYYLRNKIFIAAPKCLHKAQMILVSKPSEQEFKWVQPRLNSALSPLPEDRFSWFEAQMETGSLLKVSSDRLEKLEI